MSFHDLALSLIAFASELIGTLSGFGSSTFFVPTALLIESFHLVLALTAILHCFGNLFRILLFREHLQWKMFIRLAIPFFVFTLIGAIMTTQLSSFYMQKALGVVLILLSMLFFLKKTNIQYIFPKWLADALVAVSGFATGFVGTGGAFRGMALVVLNVPKNNFVFTSAAIDLSGDLARAFIYLKSGFMDWSHWFYIPLLGVAALIGARCGQLLLNRIRQNQFEKIVSIFILFSGILMLFES